MLNFLTDNMVIVALMVLTLVALLLLGLVFWAALQNEEAAKKRPGAGGRPQMNLDSLKQSFRGAVELIESNLAARSERYNLAWSLVLNEGDGDTSLPLVQAGLPSALSTDATLSTAAVGIVWNFFDKGVAVQLQGAYLGSPDEEGGQGQKTWDEFLGLCRGYRPERPFDSIVLSVPASLFLASDPQSQLELSSRAKAIHRRLWLAQNRFALRFPIYLVVSGCERISGFSRFAAALPEAMRRGMLGWSSPYEVGAPYQPQWIDLGMDDVTRDVSDTTAELCAVEPVGEDSSDYFMLATDVEKLRPGLKLFMDELMRPSAYHEPFIFRGFYLCGDCSPMAELLGAQQAHARLEAPTDADDLAPDAVADELDGTPAVLPIPIVGSADLEPAFLRDVFEKKVFPEAGLVRASTVQRMRHTGVNRALRWSAAGVVGVWAIGLAYSSWRLDGVSAAMLSAMQQLDRDSRAALLERTDEIDLERSRARTLATLAVMERVDAGQMGSFFMPGSWSTFDDLQLHLQKRLESSFSRNSIEPLRLSFYARVSHLTGAPVDSASGRLIVGAGCNWHGAASTSSGKPGLNPEELPEFTATSQYIAQLEELDRAVRAFERLRSGSEAASSDLKTVVRTLMGAELPGNAARTAVLFQQHAQAAPPLATAAMESAARCALSQSLRALNDRMFERNDLLRTERQLMERTAALTGDGAGNTAPALLLQNWQGVLDAMRDEEALMQPAKGAWIKRRTLQMGQAYDSLLQRAQAVSLVGRGSVDEERRQAEESFGRFLTAWDDLQNDRRTPSVRGLRWLDTEGKWAFTEERAALRDSLATLLAQPYMRPGRGKLPDVPGMASVAWDRNRLDQALAYSDSRKRFQAELLPKFPPGMQQGIERMVNAVLAEQMIDVLAQGMVLTERASSSSALVDADRQRLARVRVLLSDLGARGASESLNTVLVRDARARLRALDEAFTQGDVFVPRDLRNWTGEKGPLVVAFGTGDAMGLASYVAQQQAFIDASAREAEMLLQGIDGLDANDPLVQRWRGIVADVAKYRLKSPASSLQNLEQFILNSTADVDMANCADKLGRMAQRRGGDVFGERLVNLQVRLSTRCRELRNTEGRDGWMKFVDVFNSNLAGRAPFKTGAGLPTDRPPADVEEVATALKAYERAAKSLGGGGAAPTVKRFDEQMERVRAFMAPLFAADENAAPGYDVAVEFRANPAAELEGNKIIEWSISMGGQTLKQREPLRPLRWEPGTPIVLSMRLARDGPVAPAPDPQQPGMWVEERTVNYRFNDLWSLYSMISSHREPDGLGRSDAKSQLLRFEFPIFSNGEALKGAPDSRARVFLRLAVSPAGKRGPLAWPGSFPIKAPEWTFQQ